MKSLLKGKAEAKKNELLDKLFHDNSKSKHLLWGLLHIKIIGCTKLRNLDRLGVKSLLTKRKMDKSDPYVTAFINDYRLCKTKYIDDDLDPIFNEEFYCPGKSAFVLFHLMNECVQCEVLSECFIWPVCIFICVSLQTVCTNPSYYCLSSSS